MGARDMLASSASNSNALQIVAKLRTRPQQTDAHGKRADARLLLYDELIVLGGHAGRQAIVQLDDTLLPGRDSDEAGERGPATLERSLGIRAEPAGGYELAA